MVQHEPRPTRIDQIQFGLFSGSDMKRLSSLNVRNSVFYELGTRNPAKNGCLDPRLGISNNSMQCKTCDKDVKDCCGHFGTIELALPVFHIGYFNSIKDALSMICKECSRVLLDQENRALFSQRIADVTRSDSIHSRQYLQKEILKHCKLVKICPHCFALNGTRYSFFFFTKISNIPNTNSYYYPIHRTSKKSDECKGSVSNTCSMATCGQE